MLRLIMFPINLAIAAIVAIPMTLWFVVVAVFHLMTSKR